MSQSAHRADQGICALRSAGQSAGVQFDRAAPLVSCRQPADARQGDPFDTGSTEIKAAWRLLTARDTPAIRARYYVVNGAQVFNVGTRKCEKQDIALVGFHIVTKTPDRPQWIWSTFEQVDNVPGRTSEPKPPGGVPCPSTTRKNRRPWIRQDGRRRSRRPIRRSSIRIRCRTCVCRIFLTTP